MYAITEAGVEEFEDWLAELLSHAGRGTSRRSRPDCPSCRASTGRGRAVARANARSGCGSNCGRIDAMFARDGARPGLPELFLVESRYRAPHARRAELDVRRRRWPHDIRPERFAGTKAWRRMHELRAERHLPGGDPRRSGRPSRRGGARAGTRLARHDGSRRRTPARCGNTGQGPEHPRRNRVRPIPRRTHHDRRTGSDSLPPSQGAPMSVTTTAPPDAPLRPRQDLPRPAAARPPVRALDGLSVDDRRPGTRLRACSAPTGPASPRPSRILTTLSRPDSGTRDGRRASTSSRDPDSRPPGHRPGLAEAVAATRWRPAGRTSLLAGAHPGPVRARRRARPANCSTGSAWPTPPTGWSRPTRGGMSRKLDVAHRARAPPAGAVPRRAHDGAGPGGAGRDVGGDRAARGRRGGRPSC